MGVTPVGIRPTPDQPAAAMPAPVPILRQTTFEAADLLALVAHRFPFLLVDRVHVVEPGRRVVGIRRVTGNEWCSVLAGDGRPFPMPGTLVVEALAQASAALLAGLTSGSEELIGYFAAIQRVRLRDPARPGDTLELTVDMVSFRRGIARLRGVARTDGRLVVSAEFVTVVRPRHPGAAGHVSG